MTPAVIVHNVRHPLPDGYTAIYVGRHTSYKRAYGEDFSALGNPFTMPKYTREDAIQHYREHLQAELHSLRPNDLQVAMDALLDKLRAGDKLALSCFCSPQACHADVLKEVLMTAQAALPPTLETLRHSPHVGWLFEEKPQQSLTLADIQKMTEVKP